MIRPVFVLNGPNLNMLGTREPETYGRLTLADVEALCASTAESLGLGLSFRQTNHEGVLVDWIHEAREASSGIVLNPGAYGHTSIALHDAIRAVAPLRVVEVHLSNIHAREEFRHRTTIGPVVLGSICGFGAQGYIMALHALAAPAAEAVAKRQGQTTT